MAIIKNKKSIKGGTLLTKIPSGDSIIPAVGFTKAVIITQYNAKSNPAVTNPDIIDITEKFTDPTTISSDFPTDINPDPRIFKNDLNLEMARNSVSIVLRSVNTNTQLIDYVDYTISGNKITITRGSLGSNPYFIITIDNNPRSGIQVVDAQPKSYTNVSGLGGTFRSVLLTGSDIPTDSGLSSSLRVFSITLPPDFPAYHIGDSGNELQVFVSGDLYSVADTPDLTKLNYSEELSSGTGNEDNKGKKSRVLYFYTDDQDKKITVTTNSALVDTPTQTYKRYTELLSGQMYNIVQELKSGITDPTKTEELDKILNSAVTYPDFYALSDIIKKLQVGVTGEIISTLSRDETARGYLPLDGGVYEKTQYKRLYDRLAELTKNKELAIRTQQRTDRDIGGNNFVTGYMGIRTGGGYLIYTSEISINPFITQNFYNNTLSGNGSIDKYLRYFENLPTGNLNATLDFGKKYYFENLGGYVQLGFPWIWDKTYRSNLYVGFLKSKDGRFFNIRRKNELSSFDYFDKTSGQTTSLSPVTTSDSVVTSFTGTKNGVNVTLSINDLSSFYEILKASDKSDFDIIPLKMGTNDIDKRWWGNGTTPYFVLPDASNSILRGMIQSSTTSFSGVRLNYLESGSGFSQFTVFFHIKY